MEMECLFVVMQCNICKITNFKYSIFIYFNILLFTKSKFFNFLNKVFQNFKSINFQTIDFYFFLYKFLYAVDRKYVMSAELP